MYKYVHPESILDNPAPFFLPEYTLSLQLPSALEQLIDKTRIEMFSSLTLFLVSLALGAQAQTYKASFTEYGSGDQNGSGNCNTATTACGFYTSPGYSAAVSQNLYGAGPGQGAGPACDTCYKLTIETDSSGNTVSNAGTSIVVKVTNLCPGKSSKLRDNAMWVCAANLVMQQPKATRFARRAPSPQRINTAPM